jgi:hypothetical protein
MLLCLRSSGVLRLTIRRDYPSFRSLVPRCISTAQPRTNLAMFPLQSHPQPFPNHPYSDFPTRRFSTSGPTDTLSNPESYTETAYMNISKLPNYANTYKTQYVEVSHLLKSLYDDGPDGLMQIIISKAGISPDTFNK